MSQTTSYLRPSPAALLWPLLIPSLVFIGTELYLFGGNVLYAHGPSSYVLLLVAGWGLIACIWEVIAIPICAYKLACRPSLRTRVNLLAIVLAALYVIAFMIFVAKLLT